MGGHVWTDQSMLVASQPMLCDRPHCSCLLHHTELCGVDLGSGGHLPTGCEPVCHLRRQARCRATRPARAGAPGMLQPLFLERFPCTASPAHPQRTLAPPRPARCGCKAHAPPPAACLCTRVGDWKNCFPGMPFRICSTSVMRSLCQHAGCFGAEQMCATTRRAWQPASGRACEWQQLACMRLCANATWG